MLVTKTTIIAWKKTLRLSVELAEKLNVFVSPNKVVFFSSPPLHISGRTNQMSI